MKQLDIYIITLLPLTWTVANEIENKNNKITKLCTNVCKIQTLRKH